MLKPKTVSESSIDYYPYEIFPDDLNPMETIFGGRLLEVADRVAATVAHRHTNRICLTLLIDSVRFLAPAQKGETLVFKAALNHAWNSSMEVGIKVFAEDYIHKKDRHICSAYFTFVAINKKRKPVKIPSVIPMTNEEKKRFGDAEKRRKLRLANTK